MKLDKLSIRWKLFFYLTVFVALLIVVLWLFQTVFLDSFYKTVKTNTVKSVAEHIAHNINRSDLVGKLQTLAQENEVCIRILDENQQDLYNAETIPDCVIHRMPPFALKTYYDKAASNGGSYVELFSHESFDKELTFPEDPKPFAPPFFNRDSQSMIYIQLVRTDDHEERMILLNAAISPVNATVETIRIQLIFITIILLILAVILAFLISRKISKPIVNITASAKELAHGNYGIEFHGKGYLEISELNDTLNYAARELSKVETLRRELIANISHDLRTPLTMITGYGEVMRDIPGENTSENVQIIIDEAKHLSALVDDILDLSKLQSGAQSLHPIRYNLTQDIRDILARYQKFTELSGYHIEFHCTEDIWVSADQIKISQVIYNLVNNAINYTGDDKIVIVKQEASINSVKILVTDTGDGIPPDQLSYVWDRYYKIDRNHKRAAIGTGLGLSIIRGILELHGARYGVLSTVGSGSTFWFELPRID